MHLAVRAQPEPAEDYETGRFRGHLESQNVPIKWQQIIQVFAPDRCSAQRRDHRGVPSWRPRQRRSVEWLRLSMRGVGRWGRGEDHPTSIALIHPDSYDMRTVIRPAVISPRNHASTFETSRLDRCRYI